MYPVVNVGELTKPATVLIEKVSSAVGLLWEPHQIRRVAQARADEAMTLAKSQIEIDEIKRRAATRFVEEETKRQLNMGSIGTKALPYLGPNAPVSDMEDDWIVNFFDKCRTVSDEDMQSLWARILAGEANAPGSFSRKTVNLVSDLDKESAELFVKLCSFAWTIEGTFALLILDPSDEMYLQQRIGLFSLGLLSSIGLIQINPLGTNLTSLPGATVASYHGNAVKLTLPKKDGNDLPVGTVMFTPPGEQLSQIIETTPVDGFFDFIYGTWAKKSLVPSLEDAPGRGS